jgi:hypothetical protein
MGPLRRETPVSEPSATCPLKIHRSFEVPGKGPHLFSPNRLPMERDAPSLEPMVYSLIFMCQSPQKGDLPRNGEKYTVAVHGAPRVRKACIQ